MLFISELISNTVMRCLLIVIVLTLPIPGFAQLHLAAGTGVLNVDLARKPALAFYNDTTDQAAAKIIRIETDSTGELKLVSAIPVAEWLDAEQLFPAYDIFTLRVDTIAGKWMRIIVNNGNGQMMWLKSAPAMTFIPWSVYFAKHTSAVEVVEGVVLTIHATASDKSALIRRTMPGDCFKVSAVKGEWMRVDTAPDCNNNKSKLIRSGWIRWKRDNHILVTYSSIA